MEETMKHLRVMFIGNSHTFFNALPWLFADIAANDGYEIYPTMLAHGGWVLEQHVTQKEIRYNIKYGKYDYIVIQEHAHPMPPHEQTIEMAGIICQQVKDAGSTPVIYSTWAAKATPELQDEMNEVHHLIADQNDALYAPVGDLWWDNIKANPDTDMYSEDGEHASEAGSTFAARTIWATILDDLKKKSK